MVHAMGDILYLRTKVTQNELSVGTKDSWDVNVRITDGIIE